MEGTFVRKKLGGIAILISGVVLLGLCVMLGLNDPVLAIEFLILPLIGLLSLLLGVFVLLKNHGAYFRMDETEIHAKYHWFGTLHCNIEDVAFVFAAEIPGQQEMNALRILRKDGKQYEITGLSNAYEMQCAIRKRNFTLEAERPETIVPQLEREQNRRSRKMKQMFAFMAIMILGTVADAMIAVWEWEGIPEVFALVPVVSAVVMLSLAYKIRKEAIYTEWLAFRMRGAAVARTPLPVNHILDVYTDEDFSGRIAVVGLPNSREVYFILQTGDNLEVRVTSELFASQSELPEDLFSLLIPITEKLNDLPQ